MTEKNPLVTEVYDGLLQGVVRLLEEARKTSARSVNAIMTATYWEIGHRIVEREQEGRRRFRCAGGWSCLLRSGHDLGSKHKQLGFIHPLTPRPIPRPQQLLH